MGVSSLNFTAPLLVNTGTTTVNSSFISGNITIDPSSTLAMNFSQSLTHTGNLTNNGVIIFSSATYSFNGTGTTVTNNGTISGGSFLFNTAGAKNLGGTGSFSGFPSVEVNGRLSRSRVL
jgi:hypothetical protein